MLDQIISRLSPAQKRRLRGWYRAGKVEFVRRFRAYGPPDLQRGLAQLGVAPGDTLLVHSAFGSELGFQGSPSALIAAFRKVIGPTGNLMMVSMPYLSSTSEYLKSNPCFDVRNTASKMGLVSETFRRLADVRRSLHPTHSVLASGPQADWIVADHERCQFACGAGSPFEKLLRLEGKVLFFGVSEFHFTFHHYLEDMLKDALPFPLYEADPYTVRVIDVRGEPLSVSTYAFSREAIERRRVHVLFDELGRHGQMKRARIGNTPMVLIDTQDSVSCTRELAARGIYFYKLD